jgi:CheY-like chemotaxis protein
MQKQLLLIEDNEDDIFFMKRALKSAEIDDPLEVLKDGQDAIDYLNAAAAMVADRAQPPLPCVIFLDLKLPRKTGLEVLEFIRQQPELRTVVVLVLTTSRERRDVENAYKLGANAFLVKPASHQQLAEMMRAVKAFWLGFNEFAG